MNLSWHTITFFGDSAITIPAACILALWLGLNRLWRPMLAWLVCFGTAMFIVVVSKLLFMGWDIAPPMLNFTGFSGHTASSSALYLSIALVLTQGCSRPRRSLVLALTALAVTAIGVSLERPFAHTGRHRGRPRGGRCGPAFPRFTFLRCRATGRKVCLPPWNLCLSSRTTKSNATAGI